MALNCLESPGATFVAVGVTVIEVRAPLPPPLLPPPPEPPLFPLRQPVMINERISKKSVPIVSLVLIDDLVIAGRIRRPPQPSELSGECVESYEAACVPKIVTFS